MTQTLTPITAVAVADGGAVETAVLTSPTIFTNPNSPPIAGKQSTPWVRISGIALITPGATATFITIRCKLGSLVSSPALAGQAHVYPCTPGVTQAFPFFFHDGTGVSEASAGLQYTITVQETAATANGNVNIIGAIEALT